MSIQKPELFPDNSSFIWSVIVLFSIFFIRILIEHDSYQKFISKPSYFTNATVIISYKKVSNGRTYRVIKVKDDNGLIFYTISYYKVDFNHKRLRLQIFPNNEISFGDYLGSFYIEGKIKEQKKIPLTTKDRLSKKITSQHQHIYLKEFYSAIFLATNISKELREKINIIGVSHLVALSGFHLGILWILVYGLLILLYRPFQQKFFPYRNSLFDIGLVTLSILGFYLWFVDFPASLVRSYAMMVIGWSLLLLGVELISFRFLSIVIILLLALIPSFIISFAFWLSIAGVFYIFLILKYTQNMNNYLISLIILPITIFILMLPIVHIIFGVTSTYQLLSPILSVAFIPFYPLSIALHIFEFGSIFDSYLLALIELTEDIKIEIIELWAVSIYIILSFWAIIRKSIFILLFFFSLYYMYYIFI